MSPINLRGDVAGAGAVRQRRHHEHPRDCRRASSSKDERARQRRRARSTNRRSATSATTATGSRSSHARWRCTSIFRTVRGGDGYPGSLLGVISFVRQSLLDAQHQQLVNQRYERVKAGAGRPNYDPALDALQPALDGTLPVAFEVNAAREILRSLDMASEFKLDPIIYGAREADQVAADLKTRNARVIYNVNYPTRSRALAPDADESVSDAARAGQRAESAGGAAEGGRHVRVSRGPGSASRGTSCATSAARCVRGSLPMPPCGR